MTAFDSQMLKTRGSHMLRRFTEFFRSRSKSKVATKSAIRHDLSESSEETIMRALYDRDEQSSSTNPLYDSDDTTRYRTSTGTSLTSTDPLTVSSTDLLERHDSPSVSEPRLHRQDFSEQDPLDLYSNTLHTVLNFSTDATILLHTDELDAIKLKNYVALYTRWNAARGALDATVAHLASLDDPQAQKWANEIQTNIGTLHIHLDSIKGKIAKDPIVTAVDLLGDIGVISGEVSYLKAQCQHFSQASPEEAKKHQERLQITLEDCENDLIRLQQKLNENKKLFLSDQFQQAQDALNRMGRDLVSTRLYFIKSKSLANPGLHIDYLAIDPRAISERVDALDKLCGELNQKVMALGTLSSMKQINTGKQLMEIINVIGNRKLAGIVEKFSNFSEIDERVQKYLAGKTRPEIRKTVDILENQRTTISAELEKLKQQINESKLPKTQKKALAERINAIEKNLQNPQAGLDNLKEQHQATQTPAARESIRRPRQP